MSEIVLSMEGADPVELFGVHNHKLNLIKAYFPSLKLVPRGHQIKAVGPSEALEQFELKFGLLQAHLNRYHQLPAHTIEQLLQQESNELGSEAGEGDVIVHGQGGKPIKARTKNQRKLVQAVAENDMVFAIGPAGTGKTYTAVALAVRALKNKEVRRIILTRPAVEAGENLGFLPGDLKEKLDPYLQPLYDALLDMIPAEKLDHYLQNGIVQIAPLAFMRGRTLDEAFTILDEAQNTTSSQMKMFLTRMGQKAKFVITGDSSQIDLPSKQKSGLLEARKLLSPIKNIAFVELDESDVIRHPVVKEIIRAYDQLTDQ